MTGVSWVSPSRRGSSDLVAETTERVDLIEPGYSRSSSLLVLTTLRSIVFPVSSKTPEDAYHNALLLSKISRAEKAVIHVFYDPPLWNIDPLSNLKDDSIARAGAGLGVFRTKATLPRE